MRITKALLVIVFLNCGTAFSQKAYEFNRGYFNPEGCRLKTVKTPVFEDSVILVEPLVRNNFLILTGSPVVVPWKEYRYLVMEVWQDNNYAVNLNIFFHEGQSASGNEISARIGINPRIKTNLIFPLSYLDGQNIFLPRYPHQLKGTVQGHRIDPEKIGKFGMQLAPFDTGGFAPAVYIGKVWLASELPTESNEIGTYYVDEFGQWSGKKWPGKARNISEIREDLSTLASSVSGSTFPDEWSKYGGWTGMKFNASGFFRTEHDGKRWWFVDPEGNAFLSMGMDCVDHEISTVYSGNEDLFEWLPGPETKTKEAISGRGNRIMVDYLVSNLIRTWGPDWKSQWASLTGNLLRSYRFNTIGNWSDMNFAKTAGIPYVLPLGEFPTTAVKLYRDFPDVFDTTYQLNARKYAEQLRPYANDPWLIGYFLANEPHWAFGDNILAYEMLRNPRPSFTRKQLGSWLQDRYGSVQSLNTAWNSSFKSINDLSAVVLDSLPGITAGKDLQEFSGLMVDEYIRVVCAAVKEVDSNHLNLGLRYAWISSELCYRAGKEFDVFSINGYSNPGPPDTEEIARRSGKPVLIGEFHFGALDRGLPATGIQAAESQSARGDAYRYYLEQGYKRPEIIGIHYFQWLDQAISGRFDGENYNIGFLDICYKPYPELVNAARETHDRIYGIASGKITPVGKLIKWVPPIYY
ncbi:MAG: beta-galactosidase [Bacteroidales bacterium]